MISNVITVSADATLHEVADLLMTRHISGAPVVDESGKMVGIISESDLINEKKRQSALPRSALFGVWVVAEEALKKAYEEAQTLRAHDLMTRDVVTTTEDTPLDELAQMMVRRRINRVPVLREGKLVGIVTREDLMRGLLSHE